VRRKAGITFLVALMVFGITACKVATTESNQPSSDITEPAKQEQVTPKTAVPDSQNKTVSNVQKQKNEKVKRYKDQNQHVEKGKTVFVGSSLMEGFPIHKFTQTLDKNYRVYNRGVGSFVTADLLASMEECIFELEPSKIFINIGTNDISSPKYKKENLIANYDRILTRIKERLPDCKVFVMAYFPVNAKADFPGISKTTKEQMFKSRTNQAIHEANEAIEGLAKKHLYEFINVNEGLMDAEGNLKEEYSKDGMHMFENGYSVVFNNIKKYL